jgi:outer membrane protein assembly factor BamE (lipoprotein component of BamABCDE complex)
MNQIKRSIFQSPAVYAVNIAIANKAGILMLIFSLLLIGCATVGKDFPVDRVSEIQIGKTTQQDIREKFGHPWRVGIEDGQNTWTYGKYRYKLFGDASTQDLVIRFDNQNMVASFTFNTTEHME